MFLHLERLHHLLEYLASRSLLDVHHNVLLDEPVLEGVGIDRLFPKQALGVLPLAAEGILLVSQQSRKQLLVLSWVRTRLDKTRR
jgi:hypothetical protein